MPPQAPSFGSQQYWNQRFTSNSNPFEWLEAPTALDPYLAAALRETSDQNPEILHIGCGTSLLSYHLRAHVENPEQIHNLDYSEVAIDVGKKREVELYSVESNSDEKNSTNPAAANGAGSRENSAPTTAESKKPASPQSSPDDQTAPKFMRWSAANLLDHNSLLQDCKPSTYSIIVDKSTSDSIACSDDVYVPLPYSIGSNAPRTSHLRQSQEPIHPLHIMAIHLALLTKPRTRWISLSYSLDRYPFLDLPPPSPLPLSQHSADGSGPSSASTPGPSSIPIEGHSSDDDISLDDDLDDIPQKVIDSGLPDPATLWTLQGKYEVEVPPEQLSNGSNEATTTHRPRVLHWVYVLERTDVEVFVRSYRGSS